MTKQFLKVAVVWGTFLWFVGYILGILLFPIVPPAFIGWIIMPFGILITLWVLLKKVKADSFQQYVLLGVMWMAIAVIFDFFFLVQVFKPSDGYYKLDVFIYYALTVVLPLIVGLSKRIVRK